MNETSTRVTYAAEVTVELVAELFARNIAEEHRNAIPYIRPIDRSVEKYLLGTKAY
jgi:hypothetical protein